MTFLPEVVGRTHLKTQLAQIQRDERIKVILFYGAPGVGKHFIARAFAQSLLGREPGFSSAPDDHPDFTDLRPDAKDKIIKTDRLREEVLADIHYTPRLASKRVFVIDADALNEVGQNVLLKTLEEIPTYAYILLTVTNPEQLLITVRSRCLPLHVEPLSAVDLATVLGKHLGSDWQKELEPSQLSWLRSISAGSPGMALQYLENGAFAVSETFADQLEQAFMAKTPLGPLVHLGSIMPNKDWIHLYFALLTQFLTLLARLAEHDLSVGQQNELDWAQDGQGLQFWTRFWTSGARVVAGRQLAPQAILNMIKYITEAKEAMRLNVNFDLVVNRLLLMLGKELTHA